MPCGAEIRHPRLQWKKGMLSDEASKEAVTVCRIDQSASQHILGH